MTPRGALPDGRTRRLTPPSARVEFPERKMKRCRHCELEKPAAEFRRNPRCRDGLSSWCSECHRQAVRDWRARNREGELAAQRRRYQARAEEKRRLAAEAYQAELRRQWAAAGR
jgi:hypothetical protein